MALLDIFSGLANTGIIYSVILIGLAVFGFIISDIFKTGQYLGIPDPYKTDFETIFHFISVALLAIAITMVIFAYPIAAFLQKSFEMFLKLGFMDQTTIDFLTKVYGYSLYFSIGYILVYFFIFFLGAIYKFINPIWIEVELMDHTKKSYHSFICDSNDFYFFETKEKFNLWEGIKKSEILRITAIQETPRIMKFFWNRLDDLIRYSKKNKTESEDPGKESYSQ